MAENGDPLRTLFVGHLHPAVTDDSLRVAFQRFGTVQHVRVVRDVATGASRGYGFVTFKHESDFKDAWYDAQGMEIGGMRVLVEYERARVTKGWKPRRLGGGYGGRKESGQLRFGGRERLFRQPADGGLHPYARKPEKKKYTDPEDEPKMGVIANVSLASKSASGELSSSSTFHFVVDKHQRVKRHSL
jgi:U11/U12 small nuclear ribonucleoprotein SNRNP35